MNKKRRNRIAKVIEAIEAHSAELEELQCEEEEARENLPESLQDGEKGQAMEEAANSLEEAKDAIDELALELRELTEG